MSQNYSYLLTLDKVRENAIKALQLVQEKEGFISDEVMEEIAEYLDMPLVEIEGIISFYTQFKRVKPGKYKILVCDGTACHIKGSILMLDWISTELGIKDGETDKDGLFSLETVSCLGCCSLAPVLSVNSKVYGNLDRKATLKILKTYRNKEVTK
ncbi:MAG: NAD(P)H-dependent oxidoreductase subunit E [Verrucomicrobiota bacterium]|nr:NAD(P)H-dependent oxidoreductase subunit E [Verrucomicrobiota bacterium]